MKKVKAVQDDSGHWYVIPNEMEVFFHNDYCNEEMVDSGDFDEKYSQYMTGGDLNNIQLYTEDI